MPKTVFAAGGLITRISSRGTEIAAVHRPAYDDWSLPKGKQDPGESLEETALREVWEETALRCSLDGYLGTQDYPGKTVHYWHMRVEKEETFVPNEEIDALRWITRSEAEALLTYPQDQALLEAAGDQRLLECAGDQR